MYLKPSLNLTSGAEGSSTGQLLPNSVMLSNPLASLISTRGASIQEKVQYPYLQRVQQTRTLSDADVFEAYEYLLELCENENVFSDSVIQHLFAVVYLSFPREGLSDLITSVRDLYEYYAEKAMHVPSPEPRRITKELQTDATYYRKSSIIIDEE